MIINKKTGIKGRKRVGSTLPIHSQSFFLAFAGCDDFLLVYYFLTVFNLIIWLVHFGLTCDVPNCEFYL